MLFLLFTYRQLVHGLQPNQRNPTPVETIGAQNQPDQPQNQPNIPQNQPDQPQNQQLRRSQRIKKLPHKFRQDI